MFGTTRHTLMSCGLIPQLLKSMTRHSMDPGNNTSSNFEEAMLVVCGEIARTMEYIR